MSFHTLARCCGLMLAISTGLASAADYYWDINSGTANGDGSGAWRGGTAPANWSTNASGTTVTGTWSTLAGTGSATVQFGFGPAPDNLTSGGTVSIGNSTNANQNVTCGAMIFNASGSTGYYFQNPAGNINSTTVTLNATGTSGVSAGTGILLNASITGDIGFGKFGGGTGGTGSNVGNVGSAAVALAKAQTWTNNSTSYSLVLNGPVSGAFGLTTNGPGTIVFGGANSFSSLNVSAGTVRVTNSSGLSTGGVTVGAAEGTSEGLNDGPNVVHAAATDGTALGVAVGSTEGVSVGVVLGGSDGTMLGVTEGAKLGSNEGALVGGRLGCGVE